LRRNKHKVLKGGHMAIPYSVWDSDAMKDCDAIAKSVFIEFLRRYNGFNNGEISMSVRELSKNLSISIGTANKKIHRLIKVGLIRITKNSGFNVKGRLAREFEITFHPCNKMPAKNTFKQWKKNHSIACDTHSILGST
tara:strand:- start:387 stop:800 length:414 start_codon:yes stop_codon:yes gene_type:complete